VSGVCQCATGTVPCGQGCADTANDPNHCGGCNVQCAGDEYCNGTCQCRPGLVSSNGSCVDPLSDAGNCGGQGPCGGATPLCQNGACVQQCGNNLDACDGGCVDYDTSPLHCGDCNNPCGQDEVCSNGNCRPFEVGVGCTSCPCQACGGDFQSCCAYPGDPTLTICVDGDCP
jgi:hypothetical protein